MYVTIHGPGEFSNFSGPIVNIGTESTKSEAFLKMDQIRTGQNLTPLTTPPPAPPAAPVEAEPQAPTDRVVLAKADDGTRTYTREKLGDGIELQTWQARSGVKYEVATTPEGTRFHAEIPAGLTQQPLEINGAATKDESAVVALPQGNPNQAVQAQITPDGKVMFPLSPNGPMACFDPTSLDFGVATPATQQNTPNGPVSFQPLQEVVHADGSHTIKANTTIHDVAGGMGFNMITGMAPKMPHREVSYIQVDDKNGQVSARQVTDNLPLDSNGTPGAAPGGVMAGLGGLMGGGPSHSESALKVAKNADASYTLLGGGDLLDHMKNSLKNPMSLQSPLMGWLKDRKAQPTQLRTFTSNPVILSAMGAAAGPVATAATNAAAAPNAVPPPPAFPPAR